MRRMYAVLFLVEALIELVNASATCDAICLFGPKAELKHCLFIASHPNNDFNSQWQICSAYSNEFGKSTPAIVDKPDPVAQLYDSWSKTYGRKPLYVSEKSVSGRWCFINENGECDSSVETHQSQPHESSPGVCKQIDDLTLDTQTDALGSTTTHIGMHFVDDLNCNSDGFVLCQFDYSILCQNCPVIIDKSEVLACSGDCSPGYLKKGQDCVPNPTNPPISTTTTTTTTSTTSPPTTTTTSPTTTSPITSSPTTTTTSTVTSTSTTASPTSPTTEEATELEVVELLNRTCALDCEHNGTCIQQLQKDSCRCRPRYTGALCQTPISNGSYTAELLMLQDQVALVSTVAEMVPYVTAQLSHEARLKLEVPKLELIAECSLAGKSCGHFRENGFPQMGSCFSINHNFSHAETIHRSGTSKALNLLLFLNSTEFLSSSVQTGIKLIIHPQDMPVFPENQGRFLPTGYSVSVALRYLEIRKAHPPYGNCASLEALENIDYFYKENYTVEGCYKSCVQKQVIEACGCADPKIPFDGHRGDVEYCTLEFRSCINSVQKSLPKKCNCPDPCCNFVYEETYSSVRWPAKNHKIPFCHGMANGSQELLDECQQLYRQSHLKVEIYFKNLGYLAFSEKPGYMIPHVWSDIGSNMGLFLGFSYVTLIELPVFLYDVCRAAFGRKMIMTWKNIIEKRKSKTSTAVADLENSNQE